MSASAARRAALETVTRVRERAAYAHETLDAVLGAAALDRRDTAFATRLAYGTIATRGTLDEAVARFVTDPSRLEPTVADALAIAAYELIFMRTPARAAVSQGVELVRSVRRSAAGLANAVLRRLAQQAPDFPWGDASADISALARQYGHPQWLASLLAEQYGRPTAEMIMAADNEPAPLFIAWVPTAGTLDELVAILERDGAGPRLCALSGCVIADEPAAARASKAVAERRGIVMDAGAQFAVAAMRPESSARTVEIGAGRGSKSLLMASHAKAAGVDARLAAIDVHAYKLDALTAAAERLELHSITTVVADAITGDLGIDDGWADAVLVDAPCSGLGTLRRHPDRRWRATPSEVHTLAALGGRMLERAARLVRPGGFVVYSTCTIAQAENGDVVSAFLDSPGGEAFMTHSLAADVPGAWEGYVTPEGWFQSLPSAGGPDGHFIARLKRA